MIVPLTIRTEAPGDEDGIRDVQGAAFTRAVDWHPRDPRPVAEAELVDAVREAGAGLLSLVAELDGRIVGHVLFTPVTLGGDRAVVGLGPIAVLPELQKQGIGSALVREGLKRLTVLGHPAVVVLGAPGYYRRFGFRPASAFGVSWDREVPDEVFMAVELRPRGLAGGGVARYLPLFYRM